MTCSSSSHLNGLRYHSPTGIPSHTAHRIESRSKKGKQDSQCKLAQSLKTCVTTHQELDTTNLTASPLRESSGPRQPRSGGIGARALNPITAGPLPAILLGPLSVSFQPLCISEHPPRPGSVPGPIGSGPPVQRTTDRAAPRAEYYYTSRSSTYEQKSPERHEHAVRGDAFYQPPELHEHAFHLEWAGIESWNPLFYYFFSNPPWGDV